MLNYFDLNRKLTEDLLPEIEKCVSKILQEKQPFEKIFLTKDQALELFEDNPFKQEIISTKVPDNGTTSAYKCGSFIDLCRGPHIRHTGIVKAFQLNKVCF